MSGNPVTLADVARHTGVSASTVSRIIRGVDRSSAATRDAVLRAAAELGYVPDPGLAALSSYRHHRRDRRHANTVLVMQASRPDGSFRFDTTLIDAARATADTLGLQMHGRAVAAPSLTTALREELTSRHLAGVLLLGVHVPDRLDTATMQALCASRVPVVVVDPLLAHAPLTRISIDHAAALRRCWQELHASGHRRIALCLPEKTDANSRHGWLASFLALTCCRGGLANPTELYYDHEPPRRDDGGVARLHTWLRERAVDAVISRHSLRPFATAACLRIPEDLSYVNLGVRDARSATSGVLADFPRLVAHALHHLDAMIRARQTGIGDDAPLIALPPRWHAGTSVREGKART